MNKPLTIILSFGLGAAAGLLVGRQFFKNKYETIADREIADVKARYGKEYGEPETEEEQPVKEDKEKSVKEYAAELAKHGYTNYSDTDAALPETPAETETTALNSFLVDATDQDDDYNIETLYYYADGVVTDTDGNVINEPNLFVGYNLDEYFADGEEDVAYIRNPETKIEYEVLYDPRRYSSKTKKPSGSH